MTTLKTVIWFSLLFAVPIYIHTQIGDVPDSVAVIFMLSWFALWWKIGQWLEKQ